MKPSDLQVDDFLPFQNTFDNIEAEAMAALMVLTAKRLGDTWRPLTQRELFETLEVYKDDPLVKEITSNPFCPPSLERLFRTGCIDSTDTTVAFNDKAFERLKKWMKH